MPALSRFSYLVGAACLFLARPRPSVAEPLTLASVQQTDSLVVSSKWLADHLHDAKVVVLQIDLDGSAYAREHIPGARQLAWATVAADGGRLSAQLPSRDDVRHAFEHLGVSSDTRVVVYYASDAPSAARAVVALDYVGHTRVSLLDGGLPKWKAEKRALTTIVPVPVAGHMNSGRNANVVATSEWIQSKLGQRGMSLIDTRTDGEFQGGAERHGMSSAGHIPSAHQLQWQQLFEGDSGSASGAPLKSRAELRKLFADRMQMGDTLVTYCAVGYRASATYFAARVAGLPVKLYDGSYEEWSALKLPLRLGTTP